MDTGKAREVLKELCGVMGLSLQPSEAAPLDAELVAQAGVEICRSLNREVGFGEAGDAEKIVENIIELRNELRKAKQWQDADMIRAKLDEAGIALDDTPKGTVWKRKR